MSSTYQLHIKCPWPWHFLITTRTCKLLIINTSRSTGPLKALLSLAKFGSTRALRSKRNGGHPSIRAIPACVIWPTLMAFPPRPVAWHTQYRCTLYPRGTCKTFRWSIKVIGHIMEFPPEMSSTCVLTIASRDVLPIPPCAMYIYIHTGMLQCFAELAVCSGSCYPNLHFCAASSFVFKDCMIVVMSNTFI